MLNGEFNVGIVNAPDPIRAVRLVERLKDSGDGAANGRDGGSQVPAPWEGLTTS
jgi:hypothetical protein